MRKTTYLYVFAFMVSMGLLGLQYAHADRDRNDDRGGRYEGWHEHEREAHEWHHRHWREGHVIYEQNEPYVTYAPPVVMPPPDEYYDEQPSANFVVPLYIH